MAKTLFITGASSGFGNAIDFTDANQVTDLDSYREQYKDFIEKAMETPPKPFGYSDPQLVADLIYKCATEDTPVINYVGKDAKMMSRMTRLLGKKQMFKTLKGAAMPKFK